MARDVATVYSCGTAWSAADRDEAVADTYRWTVGSPETDKWINGGPGNVAQPLREVHTLMSRVEGNVERQAKRQDAGALKRMFLQDQSVPDKLFDTHYGGMTQTLESGRQTQLRGGAFGTGWADNVITTMQWLWEAYYARQKQGIQLRVVNLVGWSRGAVTCTMIAHAMAEAGFDQRGVRVNIFAFDPVPGGASDFSTTGKNFDTSGKVGSVSRLPPIVADYEAVLMEDVTDTFFECVRPAVEAGTRKREYPLPGSHADCVLWSKPDNPAGRIALHLCHIFLARHDTQIARPKTCLDGQLLEYYSRLALRTQTRQVSKLRRKIITDDISMRSHPYFVNHHHEEVFGRLLPGPYHALFQQTIGPGIERYSDIMRAFPLTHEYFFPRMA